ncbi:MAG: cyclopropane-fatty-acyl-phospholipid synthase family protein [Oxalicibacterium faecigallinarum]|uniref:Cyclopropane-fatty-acyl-phospholipid synthase n=1 Tax=Oxalicibacterium faecigallinarum TaxID=573741 RepID=A0A8J3AZH7_9BURK|nr:cyclopropane-fatty-acyl-phospholipid synthase family protein [Oxalicibacterium faecigallinarum]MDQ7970349.1 cyclopropane-fatty-acyl-phospholipid synthase family protein [Oxalicibacterium faecigallinarum]GGI20586.1 cyclopropane-fatty-acyl-phospholipid synthase [Oxalicibacterium faecigallinarum]
MPLIKYAIELSEHGRMPDTFIRAGIRHLLKSRLNEIAAHDIATSADMQHAFVQDMCIAPVALLPERANEQHYELPTEFFRLSLGHQLKYSCCYWDDQTNTLDQAEENALALTVEHAGLVNGQDILELGCGWGSLTLYMARHFPDSRITAVSNSHSQRQYIEKAARERQLDNITVITADMNAFATTRQFDRIVSVEMFEHMRNYEVLFERLHGWLKPQGRFFMHIFVHRLTPYAFVAQGEDDWMSELFFSGGMMPSDALPLHFQQHLTLRRQWRWSGEHYEKTANAWLQLMDEKSDVIMQLFRETYGEDAQRWFNRWRIFYMSCAELFGYADGQEWWVSHYLFERT